MKTEKPYKATSLTSAQREVRTLRRIRKRLEALLERYAKERMLMARLAADEPQFSNPLEVYEAKQVRDEILQRKR